MSHRSSGEGRRGESRLTNEVITRWRYADRCTVARGRASRSKAGLLSGGEQQMLVLARVLANRPKILLVDELSLGSVPRRTADGS